MLEGDHKSSLGVEKMYESDHKHPLSCMNFRGYVFDIVGLALREKRDSFFLEVGIVHTVEGIAALFRQLR